MNCNRAVRQSAALWGAAVLLYAGGASAAIEVQSATYGRNCGAPQHNVTNHARQTCNGKSGCDYRVDYTVIGDPAPGCAKTYAISWTCGQSPTYSLSAAAEAGFGSVLKLSCPPPANATTGAAPSAPPTSPKPPVTAPAPLATAAHYRVENLVFKAPDIYQNPRNYHDFKVDWASCTVTELNRETQQGRERIQVHVCRKDSRLTFTAFVEGGGVVDYDWAFSDGGRTIGGAWRQGSGFGPSVGGLR